MKSGQNRGLNNLSNLSNMNMLQLNQPSINISNTYYNYGNAGNASARAAYPQQNFGMSYAQQGFGHYNLNNNNGYASTNGLSQNGFNQNTQNAFGMNITNPYNSSNLINPELTLNSQRQTAPTSTYQMPNQTFNYEYYNNTSKNLISNSSSFNSGPVSSRKKEEDPFKSLLSFK